MAELTTVDPTDTLAVLKAAEDWLRDSAHWTTEVLWRDENDSVLAKTATEAVPSLVGACARTCASGALVLMAGGILPFGAIRALDAVLAPVGIVTTNDGPNGHARIMAGLRRAIEAVEAVDG